jgi:hypothetical protein
LLAFVAKAADHAAVEQPAACKIYSALDSRYVAACVYEDSAQSTGIGLIEVVTAEFKVAAPPLGTAAPSVLYHCSML